MHEKIKEESGVITAYNQRMHEESRPLLLGFKTKQFSLYDKNINLNPLENVLYALQLKKAYFIDLEEK